MCEQFDIIVNNWVNHLYLKKLIEQQPKYYHIAEKLDLIIERLYKQNKYIIDYELLKLTKPFNDTVYEKYGLDGLLEGIRSITGIDIVGNDKKYIKLIKFNLKKDKIIIKGSLKERNRIKILKYLSETNRESF